MTLHSKRVLALVSAMAMLVPVASTVELPQLSSVSVSAEDDTTTDDTTTAEDDTTDTELVNGEVPSPASDFTFNASTGTIKSYNGLDTEVVIPKYIDGVPVRVIGESAFYNKAIVKVTIPNTVITFTGGLNGGSFRCSTLNEVVFEEGSNLSNISSYSFYRCGSLKKIVLPESLNTIGANAFQECTNLEEIVIPSKVTTINGYAFDGCTSLKTIDFGNVNTIDEYAFNGCTGLTEVDIPGAVKTIGQYAFCGCSSLTTVTFNEGLVSIGDAAFADCTGIQNVDIPDGVLSIGRKAFSGTWASMVSGVKSLTLPENVIIGELAFAGAKIQYLELKDGTTVGDEAFYSCGNIVELTTTGSVSIGRQSFYDCSGLTKATFSRETTLGSDSIGGQLTTSWIDPQYSTGLVIYGYKGSNAESFASTNSIKFVDLEAEDDDTATIGESDTTVSTDKGDVNGDGEVNGLDLLRLKKYILGLIDTL